MYLTINLVFCFLKIAVRADLNQILPNALGLTLDTTEVILGTILQTKPSLKSNLMDPDYDRTLPELIVNLGYPVQQYQVQTEDGYVLGLYRIPRGKNNTGTISANKKAILIVHGNGGNAWDYVINYYSYQNLACILVDAGYDVFLGNLRGNIYSQKHVTLSPNQSEFWNFNFDEIGFYDLPALIDFVLVTTGQRQLTYIAHSLGTTSLFVLLSTRTEYNDKINIACAMSPVAKMRHSSAPLIKLSSLSPLLTELIPLLTEITGVKGMIPATALQPSFKSRVICGVEVLSALCRLTDQLYDGLDSGHINMTRLPVLSHHSNSGTSAYILVHYAQIQNTDEFKMYDYGQEENIRRYNRATPPFYQLDRITTKIGFYSSYSDALADQKDIDFLRQSIGSVIVDHIVEAKDYSHIDFLWAKDAYKYVYNLILKDIKKYG